MPDKPIAGLRTAVAVAPLCLVCALGPAAFVAAAGSFLAWRGGFTLPLVAAVVALAGWVARRAFQGREQRSPAAAGLELKR
ncbi:MAG: hypothetical protein AB7O44_32190 [Hyphomicrobiaceae bacterium]